MSSVSVVHCNENGDTCEECLLGNSTCSKSASGHTGTLNFSGNLMMVGGVPTVDPILERPGQSALVTSTCGRVRGEGSCGACGEGGACVNDWFSTSCICETGTVATSCAEAKKPFGIGGGSFVELIPQEKHRRTLLLGKDASSKTISFYLRSQSQNGIIMFSGTDDEHTILQIVKGKLVYSSRMNSKQTLHDFLDPYVPSITIGGQWEQLTGDGQFNDVSGCVKVIVINNEVQQQNSSGYFKLYHHGNPDSLCQSEALGIDNVTTDPLSIGVILVIVFFVILLVVILVSFLVFRRRKLKRDKGPGQTKQNGSGAFLASAPGETHRGHPFAQTPLPPRTSSGTTCLRTLCQKRSKSASTTSALRDQISLSGRFTISLRPHFESKILLPQPRKDAK
ncbi:cadherin-related tumor suppressor [Caerostris extrusa]|uniref:Cadherin-related tumor suppressor n=1 Tax=Caerostris extrusa TaxID=172846 RepID=A0AAV4TRJ1_CAEEX|nr:cadherin-related tumor suppressor [Caerostris extrusa]